MKILVLNGPNLNMLGKRDQQLYSTYTLDEINSQLDQLAQSQGIKLLFFQSNHEGKLIDFLQNESASADGILINPGALTHYGYSLRDALIDTKLPVLEVHLSDIDHRDDFRKIDTLNGIVIENIMGLKEKSYYLGLEKLVKHIKSRLHR